MSKKILILIVILAATVLVVGGCKKKTAKQPATKTAAEYKAEAEKEITKENMAAELKKIEEQMEADLAEEQ